MTGTTEFPASAGARPQTSGPRWVEPKNGYVPLTPETFLRPLGSCFEEQVRRYGPRTALKDCRRALTYDALNRAANRVAQRLVAQRSHQTGPVAIFAENEASAIIAVLAALKSGRPYVPLDSRSSPERIRCMVSDAQAATLLASGNCAAQARQFAEKEVSVIDVDDPGPGLGDGNPNLALTPATISAILYTSGSTGQPKGLIYSHALMLKAAAQITKDFHICAEDRVALVVPYGLSSAVALIFGALLNGAALLPFDVNTEGITCLAGWLRREEVTILHWVPGPFRRFAQGLRDGETFPKVRLLSLGGDTTLRRDVDLYKSHFSKDCLLRLGLGVTEAGRTIARVLMDQATDIRGDTMPVGYAVDGVEILLLGEDGNEVTPDGIGEIVLKSASLSPGYWRRPDLTARAFQPAPEGGGICLYRTGDLGRMSSDGCVWHLGRKDFQAKVSGQRIELTEVEAALLAMPEVKEAAVVARPDAHGDLRLVAYVVVRQEPAPPVRKLRADLMKSLSTAAVPSAFIFLNSLPATPNGKVDRRALPEPPDTRPLSDSVCTAPRNALEERLTRMWEKVLGVQLIGVQDNFFELGGHSLAAARLFAEIEEVFGKSLPLPLLLQRPTIERLAEVLAPDGVSDPGSFLVPIQAKGTRPPLFCVDTINAGVFAHLARHLGPEQPCYGLHPFGLDRSPKPRLQIESLALRYLEEVRKVQPQGPYFLSGMCAGGMIAFEMAQQLKLQGRDVGFLALLEVITPEPRWLELIHFGPVWNFIAYQYRMRTDHLRHMSRLTLKAQMAYIRHMVAKRAARLESRRNDLLLSQLNAYVRAMFLDSGRAMREYTPRPYAGRLVLFLASETATRPARRARRVWGKLAMGGADAYMVPGMHEQILDEPNVRVLAKHFKTHLDEAQKCHRTGACVQSD
jgi:amino acid adenylation domain-containing protein